MSIGLIQRTDALATTVSQPSKNKKRKAAKVMGGVSPPRKVGGRPGQGGGKVSWRYQQPKKSKWDIRHTKSFRFEIRSPKTMINPSKITTTGSNNGDTQDSSTIHVNEDWDVMPLHKKPRESLSHVIGKGLIWSLYKDRYGSQPNNNQTIMVETPIPQEDRFVPDVVAFQHHQQQHHPTFWGESGRMSADKAATLAAKYPHTHIVHLRWGSALSMDIFEEIEIAVLPTLQHRTAPIEFALIQDEPKNFLSEDGTVLLRREEDVHWRTARFDIDPNY